MFGTGVVFGGWAVIQSMHKGTIPTAQNSTRVALPDEVDATITRLAPVRRFDEATMGRESLRAQGLGQLTVKLEPAVTDDALDIALVDPRSYAVRQRTPAHTSATHSFTVPAGEHLVTLVRRGRSARRAYMSRRTAHVDSGDTTECSLDTRFGSVTVALGALSKPPIVELARTSDPAWHAEQHSSVDTDSNGTFQVRFEHIALGSYLVLVHGLEAANTRHPVTVRGDELVKINSQLR